MPPGEAIDELAKHRIQRQFLETQRQHIWSLVVNGWRSGVIDDSLGRELLPRINQIDSAEGFEELGEELLRRDLVPVLAPRQILRQHQQEEIDDIQADLDEVAEQQEVLGDEIDNLPVLADHLDGVGERVERLAEERDALEEELETVREEREELRREKDRLEGLVEDLREYGEDPELEAGSETGMDPGDEEIESGFSVDDIHEEDFETLDLGLDWEDYDFPVIIRDDNPGDRGDADEPDEAEG